MLTWKPGWVRNAAVGHRADRQLHTGAYQGMKNRYAGPCACGSQVAKGGGTVAKAGGEWRLRCLPCTGTFAGYASRTTKPRKAARKSAGPEAVGAGWRGPARRTRRKGGFPAAKGARKAARVWRDISAAALTAEMAIVADPAHTACIELPCGGTAACSEAYLQVSMSIGQPGQDADRELDLLVCLAELSMLGHVEAAGTRPRE